MLPRIVLSSNRLDLRQDLTWSLKSILTEYGVRNATLFVDYITAIVNTESFYAYLVLPSFLGQPSLATLAYSLAYSLDLISAVVFIRLVYEAAPAYTSGASRVVRFVDESFTLESLLDYFGMTKLDPRMLLAEPELYMDWIDENFVEFTEFTTAVRGKNIPRIITEVTRHQTGFNPVSSQRSLAEIERWATLCYSESVMGADYNQRGR